MVLVNGTFVCFAQLSGVVLCEEGEGERFSTWPICQRIETAHRDLTLGRGNSVRESSYAVAQCAGLQRHRPSAPVNHWPGTHTAVGDVD